MTGSTRTALITGASAGIGQAYAEFLAAEGFDLILVARREDRLQVLAKLLAHTHGRRVEVIAADLSDSDTPERIVEEIARRGLSVDYLVNNAGFANNGAFTEQPWKNIAAEMQVMMTSLTELIHRLLPGMQQQGWGRVVNVSSVAAFAPPISGSLYTGIKSFVLHLSQALDMELKPQGIHVTALCPGFTRTEFHDVMGVKAQTQKLPSILWSSANDVVQAGHRAVMNGEPVCVPGAVNKALIATTRHAPLKLGYWMGKHLNPL